MSRWAGEWGVQLGVGPRCWDKRKCRSAPDLPLKSPGLCGFLAQDVGHSHVLTRACRHLKDLGQGPRCVFLRAPSHRLHPLWRLG